MNPTPSVKQKLLRLTSGRPKVTYSAVSLIANFEVEKHYPFLAYFLRIFFSLSKLPMKLTIYFSVTKQSGLLLQINQLEWLFNYELEYPMN